MADGGWTSKSECGPELPQAKGTDKDHGANKLAKMVQSHPNYTHGKFIGGEDDYGVDRKNVAQAIPPVDKGTQTGTKGSTIGPKTTVGESKEKD